MDEIRKKELEGLLKIPQETHPERLFAADRVKASDLIVYDMGCGRHKTISRAVGIDVKRVTDIKASIDYLPMIKSDTAHIIVSRHSLEHLIDPVKALREWHRILRPEGKLVLVLPDHGAFDTMDFSIGNGVHLHAYTRGSLCALIEAVGGFIITEIQTVIDGWSFGIVVRKKGEEDD